MKKLSLAITLLVLFSGLAFAQSKALAPDFKLVTINGDTVRLADFKGKVVVIDFWATWCPPCRQEIPGFVELKKKYHDKVEIIGISVDQSKDKVVDFYKKNKMNYPVGMATRDIIDSYNAIQKLMYIPTTFIVDRSGKIHTVKVGYTEKSEFERIIKNLLSDK